MAINSNVIKYIVVSILSFTVGLFTDSLVTKVIELSNIDNTVLETDIIQVKDKEMEKGFLYTGSIRKQQRYGQGRMITPKGTIYEGEWIGNQIVMGTMITDKSEYDGRFKNLSPDGYGTMRYKDGSFYRGMWQTGSKSGIGLFVDSIGNKVFGLWNKGLIEKETMNKNIGKSIFGIDISHHNKIGDWGNMALYIDSNERVCTNIPENNYSFQPIDFVFIKATEGATHRDRNYLTNMANAKMYHKKRGSYHFMHLTSSSVEEQVENFLDYIVYEKGDLPPVVDIEVIAQAENVGMNATRQKVLEFCSHIEARLGITPIIYTSAKMKQEYFSTTEFEKYDFWIAHYKNTEPEHKGYKIWQFTDEGILHGNDITVDVNIFRR